MGNMALYNTILFDIDDTLMDFRLSERAALHNTFLDYGMPDGFSRFHDSYREISSVLWRDLEQGTMPLATLGTERFKRLFHQHGLEFSAEAFGSQYLDYLGRETHLFPEAEAMVLGLSHCRLAVITNGFGAVQKARIKNSPMQHLFEHIIISEEAGYQKPHTGIFDYAFKKLGMKSKDSVLIVGDSLTSDIKGGVDYGISTCWFNPQGKLNGTAVQPTHEIRCLSELQEIVNGKMR